MSNVKMFNNQRGQTLAFALIAVLIITIFTTTLVSLLRQETKWAVKHVRSTTAFHLAEAAVDRGLWKLREGGGVWDSVADGTLDSDYKGQKEFTDVEVEGGKYKITISTMPDPHYRKIVGIGRDSSIEEVRAIEIIVYIETVQSPIQAAVIGAGGNAMVFWGPYMSRGALQLNGSNTNQLYPRKFARGAITASGGSYPTRDDDGSPSTDDLEWWSYNHDPGVPDLPELDFDEYKDKAIADGHYYTTNQNWSNRVDTDEKTYYFENNFRLTGQSYIKGDIICMADFRITGQGALPRTITPHDNAWEEYQKNCPIREDATDDGVYDDTTDAYGDTSAMYEYPGDGGHHISTPVVIGNGDSLGGGKDNEVTVEGFIYVKGTFDAGGGTCIYGAIMVDDSGDMSGGFEVYYKSDILLETTGGDFKQASWKEIKQDW